MEDNDSQKWCPIAKMFDPLFEQSRWANYERWAQSSESIDDVTSNQFKKKSKKR